MVTSITHETERLPPENRNSRSSFPSAKASFESTGTSDSSPALLATPEFKDMDDNFDSLGDPNQPPSTLKGSAFPPPDMTASTTTAAGGGRPHHQTSPRHSTDSRRSSNGQRKRDIILHKSGSWRKKYASLIGSSSNESSTVSGDHTSTETPSDNSHEQYGMMATRAPPAVQSTTTGCYISAPMSPPVGYPMPQIGIHPPRADHHHHHHQQHHQPESLSPTDPRASVISSSSGSSSGEKAASVKSLPPTAPRWAQPPGQTPPSGSLRSASFDSGLNRSEVKLNPETMLDPAGEWVEVLKGEQGRIAIKSTPAQYEVMVWLPGFRIDDITIVSRRHQVLHIVADQWEENDHAQWEIKLGDDAMMTNVRASFTGQELKITVQRSNRLPPTNQSVKSNVTMRTASSRAAPSMAATLGHTHERPYSHDRSFSSPTQFWGEQERQELEARMTRGTAAMGLM